MGKLIAVQFITLDGVVEDPDGSDGTAFGGWAMRYGPEGVSGDKFRVVDTLAGGVLLLGRRTWEHFSTVWPRRDDPFSQAMNRAEKAVVTSRRVDNEVWANSRAVPGPPVAWIRDTLRTRDIVLIGSGAVLAELVGADLVDEYRLLTFPVTAGSGRRLFAGDRSLALVSAERVGPAVLTVYSTRAG